MFSLNTYMDGVQAIAMERDEQINLHGLSIEHDVQNYPGGTLQLAAQWCLSMDDEQFPHGWDRKWQTKIKNKSREERLVIAGALIAAEIDRIKHTPAHVYNDPLNDLSGKFSNQKRKKK